MRVNKYNVLLEAGVPFLVKESGENIPGIDTLNQPDKVYELFKYLGVCQYAEEHMYMLALGSKCKLLGLFEVSHGTVNASLVSPREILMRALLCGAAGIILVHNHPSGDVTPIEEDIKTTERMKNACQIMNVELFDHIIVGDGYESLREKYIL